MRVVSVERLAFLLAGGTALATLGLFALVGNDSADGVGFGLGARDSAGSGRRPALELFGAIVGRNVPLALLMFSGVATAALTTLVACMLVGVYLGATFTFAAQNVGAASMFGSIAVYGPVELLGFLLAATAGLLPVARSLVAVEAPAPGGDALPWKRVRAYLGAIASSLRLLAAAVALLLLAATLETVVISAR